MFPLPFGDLRRHPEAVNADCDHDEQEPLDPQAKKAYSGASEHQLSALNERVLRPPLFHEDKAERVADPHRDYCDQPTEQRRAEIGSRAAIEAEASFLTCLTFWLPDSSFTLQSHMFWSTENCSLGQRKWAGQLLTSCRDPFSEQEQGNTLNLSLCAKGDLNCSVPPYLQNHESAFWRANKGMSASQPVGNCIDIPAPAQGLAPELPLFAVLTCGL